MCLIYSGQSEENAAKVCSGPEGAWLEMRSVRQMGWQIPPWQGLVTLLCDMVKLEWVLSRRMTCSDNCGKGSLTLRTGTD